MAKKVPTKGRPKVEQVAERPKLKPLRVDLPPDLMEKLDNYMKRIGSTKSVYIRMLLIADLRAKGVIE